MASATFIGYDLVSSGRWLTVAASARGSSGYSLAGDSSTVPIQSLPSWISSVNYNSANWDGSGPTTPGLDRPGGGANLRGRYYGGTTYSLFLNASTTTTSYLSIYCVDDAGSGRRQTITILDGGTTLASHAITQNFEGGVWVCFQVSGTVTVQFSLDAGPNWVVSGFAWDLTQPTLANTQNTTPATGGLTIGDLTAAGSATTASGSSSTGALSVDPVSITGTAAVGVPASGGLVIDPITATGSAGIVVDATGVLNLDPLAITGGASVVVTASGSLAIDPITLAGSSSASVINATGVLTLDPLSIAGAASVVVPATGLLNLDPLSIAGTAGIVVSAVGALALDDLVAIGSQAGVIDAVGSLVIDPLTIASTASSSDAVMTVDPFAVVLIVAASLGAVGFESVDPYQAVVIR